MIPDSFIEELKYVSEIEQIIAQYVTLKRQGSNFTGLCPFHSEKTPSFTVFPQTQSYYCFGCGNGGDVITFIRQVENLDYVETIRFLADRGGLVVPESTQDSQQAKLKTRVLEINRHSARFFHECLLEDMGLHSRAYLKDRGLTFKTIRTFGIGFAPDSWDSLKSHLKAKGYSDEEMYQAAVVSRSQKGHTYDLFRNRIIFPIIDIRGNVIGFGGRLMGEKGPKYINTPDTPVFKKSRNLFSLNFAKNETSDTLILGEGYMDVIAMYQAGFKNSVATLGTALTVEQARLIAQYATKVVIAYDSDSAGQNAAKRAINLFDATSVSVSVLELGDAKDPDEYIKEYGAQRFSNLMETGKSAMDFEIDKLKEQYNLNLSDDKVSFLREFCRLMSQIDNPLQRDVYIGQVANELDVTKESVITTVDSIRRKNFYTNSRKKSRELASSISRQAGTTEERNRKNIGGIVAEEHLITMLMMHPDYYKYIKGKLDYTDFSDKGYSDIFRLISQKIEENQSLELIHFSSELSNNLMAKLSQLTLKGRELKFYPEQAMDYVNAIKDQGKTVNPKQVAEMSRQEYDDYIKSLRSDIK